MAQTEFFFRGGQGGKIHQNTNVLLHASNSAPPPGKTLYPPLPEWLQLGGDRQQPRPR